jgi:hypothetical protein
MLPNFAIDLRFPLIIDRLAKLVTRFVARDGSSSIYPFGDYSELRY